MNKPAPGKLKRSVLTSWITSLLSITLVLIMTGLLGLTLVNAKKLSDFVREKMPFTLVVDESATAQEIAVLQEKLLAENFAGNVRYVGKDEAAEELKNDLGEDFIGFLGYNPLNASIELQLHAGYTHPDSLKMLKSRMLDFPQIKDVYYQENLAETIHRNTRKFASALLTVSALLALIFIFLIHNTIRLSVYAQRFTINTMQLVGAKNRFIRRPFLVKSFWLGLAGSVLATLALLGGLYSFRKDLEEIISLNDISSSISVLLLIFAAGLLFSLGSTFLTVNKFLRMRFDEMFY